jgi:non-ribosomal peptide synthetase component F
MAGATLVPARPGVTMLGEELARSCASSASPSWPAARHCLRPSIRSCPNCVLLLVGGEACPHNLVKRWYRPGRRILNSYGPTEATVTATLTELTPDKPVTIGVPLSTYSIMILDPNENKAVAPGELGEIGIAGVGPRARLHES